MLYETGWGAIALGIVVLLSYALRKDKINEAAKRLMGRRVFYAWLVSALVTASCFLALVWVYSRKELTTVVFVTGMYIFMFGAIAWPWTLQAYITPLEVMALATTAIGSCLLFSASINTMAVPLTAFIFWHHLVVDLFWWSFYGRS